MPIDREHIRLEGWQILAIFFWYLGIAAFLLLSNYSKENISTMGKESNIDTDVPINTIIDRTNREIRIYDISHYFVIKNKNIYLTIIEEIRKQIEIPIQLEEEKIFEKPNNSLNYDLIEWLKFKIRALKDEMVDKVYYNYLNVRKGGDKNNNINDTQSDANLSKGITLEDRSNSNLLKKILFNANKSLLSVILILMLFLLIAHCLMWFIQYGQSQIIEKIYKIIPHFVIFQIAMIGIIQAIITLSLGGIFVCPLGTTLSTVMPVLFYQSYSLYRQWNPDSSRVKHRSIYWIPFFIFILSHIISEIILKNKEISIHARYIKELFIGSNYIILISSIGLGIISLSIRIRLTRRIQATI